MSDLLTETPPAPPARTFGTPAAARRLRRRHAAEARFRFYGQAAIAFSVLTLGWLLVSILSMALPAFDRHVVTLDVPAVTTAHGEAVNSRARLIDALHEGVDLHARRERLQLVSVSAGAATLRDRGNGGAALRIPVSDAVDRYLGRGETGPLSAQQVAWVEAWRADGRIAREFDRGLFTNADSRDPERAGLATAMLGSLMIVFVAGAVALPVGIGAAIYLDSFAPRTGWGGWATRALEVNLNNLAAVPPIVFGLLGLAVFINLFGLMRSIPLVGGLVLALRMFPTVVIATRGALASVPSTITDGALSLGASRMQAVFGHKFRFAAPGMLTGSVIGMAQALGETAPLLMIGMVAFVTRVPDGPLDPGSALPVQIYLWSGANGTAWAERASAAIIVLLVVLLLINATAVVLRDRLQRERRF